VDMFQSSKGTHLWVWNMNGANERAKECGI
jgi:hypothetical protein